METLDEFERRRIFDNLSVGSKKPLGYLPLATIEKVLAMNIAEVTNSLQSRGFKVEVLQESDCCIKSGALYVYDPTALQQVLDAAAETLKRSHWPICADSFVKKVAKLWVQQTDPVHGVIQRVFGES